MSDKEKHHLSHLSEESSETLEHGAFADRAMQQVHAQLMREKEEPREGFAPIPIFLLFAFGALMFWGGIYITRYSGNFRGDVFDYHWQPGAAETTVAAVFDPMKQGKKLFSRQCQQCHQANGEGIPGVYPTLVSSPWLLNDDARPVKILLGGMVGEIEVNGKKYDGNMPAVGHWKDKDIAAVLTYVRSQWGNEAPPIEESLVTEIREAIGKRSTPWNAQELLEAHPLQ